MTVKLFGNQCSQPRPLHLEAEVPCFGALKERVGERLRAPTFALSTSRKRANKQNPRSISKQTKITHQSAPRAQQRHSEIPGITAAGRLSSPSDRCAGSTIPMTPVKMAGEAWFFEPHFRVLGSAAVDLAAPARGRGPAQTLKCLAMMSFATPDACSE